MLTILREKFSALKNVFEHLKSSAFFKNVSILVTGTALSQAIPVLISPLITRLYDPSSFGLFAIYISVISILNTIATGRYDKAIVIPEKNTTSKKLTVLSQTIVVCFTVLLFVIIYFFSTPLFDILNISGLKKFAYFIPVGVFIMASNESMYHWANKIEFYKRMSISKVSHNLSAGTLQVMLGYFKLETLGLLLAKVIGLLFSYLILLNSFKFSDFFSYSWQDLKKVSKRYGNFPLFLLPAHLLNSISLYSPPLLLAYYFNSAEIGFFGLTQRAVLMPVSIVSRSIGDVFRQKAAEHYNKFGSCRKLYFQTLLALLAMSIIPFLVLLFLSPYLFEWVFGDEWKTAGDYAQILSFIFLFQFISAPLNNIFLISEKQKQELVWQIIFFFGSTASIFIGYAIFNTVTGTLITFAFSKALAYLIGIFMTVRLTEK